MDFASEIAGGEDDDEDFLDEMIDLLDVCTANSGQLSTFNPARYEANYSYIKRIDDKFVMNMHF